jgi:TP901 family phage tail tape measure protein
MALSTRELLLVLRARDEASRVLRGLSTEFSTLNAAAMAAARNQISAGSSLVSLGVGMAAAGAAGLAWLAESTQQAMAFERSVAKVATQTDNVKVSQKELGDVIKGVANTVAVPIDQLANGLYDIFSSMEVNLPQATDLLEKFAKEAVAGQVDLQTASRATIGILNAFHLPASEVNRVLDVQFQLVRKGVGTFEQFAGAVGKATPAAQRAGQSIETLSGMLAFLTRNGLSADMAAASAGRALEAFAHPKTVQRMEKLGVHVKDAAGNFREFGPVIQDLQKRLEKLTAPERAAALQDLFKSSGGTIQARRFYDAVLKDSQSVEQFLGLVGDMKNAQGAFTEAYDTMSNTAASKSELLANKWAILRIEVGEALLPALEQLMEVLGKLLDWWNQLDDGTKRTIVTIVAVTSVFLVLLGIAVALAGAFLMLAGAAAVLGIGVGALLGIFALIGLAIVALIAIGYLIWDNWDKITKALGDAWNWLLNNVLKPVYEWIKANIGERLSRIWNDMKDSVGKAIEAVGNYVRDTWNDIVEWTTETWNHVKGFIQPIADGIVRSWEHVKDALSAILRIIGGVMEGAWEVIKGVLKGAWEVIKGIVTGIIKIFQGIIDFLVGIFTGDWSRMWRGIVKIFEGVWAIIKGVVLGVVEVIVGLAKGFWEVITTIWEEGGDLLLSIWKAIWETLKEVVLTILKGLKSAFVDFPLELIDTLSRGFTGIAEFFGLAGESWVEELERGMTDKGPSIFETVNGLMIGAMADMDPHYAKAREVGRTIIEMFIGGSNDGKGAWFSNILSVLSDTLAMSQQESKKFNEIGKAILRAMGIGVDEQRPSWIAKIRETLGYTISEMSIMARLGVGPGRELIEWLGRGMEGQKGWLGTIVGGIQGVVRGIASDTGWAHSQGASIITGLGSGIQSRVPWFKGVLGAITAMIPQQKGPPEKDKMLLYRNGQLVLEGFINGIKSMRGTLQGTLQSVTNDVTAAGSFDPFDMKPNSGAPLSYMYTPPGSGGVNVSQQITMHTPEVVPQRDAAILGYELSRRA